MSITGDAAVSINALTSSSAIGIIGFCEVYILDLEFDAAIIGINAQIYGLSCIADLSAEWLMAAVAIQPIDSMGEFGWIAMCEVLSPDAQAALLVGIMMGGTAQIEALTAYMEMGWWVNCEYTISADIMAAISLMLEANVSIPSLSALGALVQNIVGSAAVTMPKLECTGIYVREFTAFCHVSIEALRMRAAAAASIAGAAHVVLSGFSMRSSLVVEFSQTSSMGLSVGCSAYLDNGPPAETELTYEELNP